MSYGIEVFDENGIKILGMEDFTYSKIFETNIPASGTSTSPYNVTVPGYSDENCVVVFSPLSFQGEQPGFLPAGSPGFVPTYRSPGGEVVAVVQRALATRYDPNSGFVPYYTNTPACRMEVYRVFGGS